MNPKNRLSDKEKRKIHNEIQDEFKVFQEKIVTFSTTSYKDEGVQLQKLRNELLDIHSKSLLIKDADLSRSINNLLQFLDTIESNQTKPRKQPSLLEEIEQRERKNIPTGLPDEMKW
jgi:hypothetical protein